jgi:hypothetical protein
MTSSRRRSTPAAAASSPAETGTTRATLNRGNAVTINRSNWAGMAAKVLITVVALVAVAYVAWLLVTSAGLGTFPVPAGDASDVAKVGSFMIRFGLVIIALAVAVLLGTQILALILPERAGGRGAMNWVEFMKALGELIKTPAGIGFGVVILGVILMFPTVFATP